MLDIGKVGIIGLGKMGEAIVSGLLLSKSYSPQDISAYEIIPERSRYISSEYGIRILNTATDVTKDADIVILVVKPKDMFNALQEIIKTSLKSKIIISVAAGIDTPYLSKHLPEGTELIRAMPNLACSLGEGMICLSSSQGTSKESLIKATELFKLTGKVLHIAEKDLAAVTGISGSGPAYVYAFIEALADAGVQLGLKNDVALILATQTAVGASKIVLSTGENPTELKKMVATPGGTTIEGLKELEKGGLNELIKEAVSKATRKSQKIQDSINNPDD
tara:strand:- start:1564 stop:2397 length:834 start_codon:yes stop_codon:yes gene_type:complete